MKKYGSFLCALILIIGLAFFFRDSVIAYIDHAPATSPDPQSQAVATNQSPSDPGKSSPAGHSGANQPTAAPPSENYTGTVIPILMYHEVTSGPNSLYVPVEKFREQMQFLAKSGYHTVTMAQAREMLREKKIPAKTIVLTFDDGYTSVYTNAWPILQEYGFTGTVYVCTSFFGRSNYLTIDQTKQLAAAGIEIGSHTCNHISLKEASYDQQVKEIVVSKQVLEENLGQPCLSFCYPTGTYSDITPGIIKDAGYTSAVTVAYGHASPANTAFLTPRVRVPGWITLDKFAQSIPK